MCKVFPYNDMLKDGPTCLTRHLVSQLESKKTQAREYELASFSLWVEYSRFLLSIYFISYLLRFHDKADELFFLPPSLILPFRLGLGLVLLKFVYFSFFTICESFGNPFIWWRLRLSADIQEVVWDIHSWSIPLYSLKFHLFLLQILPQERDNSERNVLDIFVCNSFWVSKS